MINRTIKQLEDKIKKLNKLIYSKQQKEIEKVYEDIAKELTKILNIYNTDTLTEYILKKIQKELEKEIKNSNKQITSIIENNATLITLNSSLLHNTFFKYIDSKYNTNLYEAYKKKTNKTEKEVISKIKDGVVYRDNYKLSQRIWGNNNKVLGNIDAIINEGIKEKKDPYTIAKELEIYVKPSAQKDWSWKKVYPNSNKKVDYNAQRLARTSLTHAHQLASQAYAMKNPFIEYLVYNSAHNARTCDMCASRDGELYKKDDVPLDHPNGNCFMTVYIPDNIDDMIAQMVNDGTIEDYLDDL